MTFSSRLKLVSSALGLVSLACVGLPAKAADVCGGAPGPFSLTLVTGANSANTCTVNDKTLSNFAVPAGFTAGFFTFTEPTPGAHELSFQPITPASFAVGGPYTFSYTIAVTSGIESIRGQSNDISSSVQTPPPAGTHSTQTVNGAVVTTSNSSLGLPSPISFLSTPQTTLNATEQITVTAGVITGWKTTYYQTSFFVEPTPGPLPLLGAASAFGFSRRIRRRIKSQVA